MLRKYLQPSLGLVFVALGSAACSNSGVVSGAKDTHCDGQTIQPASFYSCPSTGSAMADEAETVRYNDEADDDDCKYHVKWSATNVAENTDVNFTVDLTWKKDGTPVTGGAGRDTTYIEAFLTEIHPAPTTQYTSTEKSSGVYEIGPIHFDAKGRWTVKFHFFGNCDEADDSKHGHVEFYVQVP